VVSSLTGFALNFASYGTIFVVTLTLQQELGRSAWTTGLVFVPMTLLIIPANLIAGRLASPLRLGQLLMIAGLLGLGIAGTDIPLWQVVAWLLPIGAGAGLVAPAATTMMLGGVPPDRTGVGAGLLNAARQFGSGTAPAIFGPLLSAGPAIGFRLSIGLAAAVVAASLSLTGVPGPAARQRS
jgi:DHA2 family methylenomycin A resistance protein-like MFS transporter